MLEYNIDKAKPRVLYVDDEPENLHSFKALFRRDYDIYLAESAEKAMEILRREEIHVLVTDQRMPGMNGSELLGKTVSEFPDILRFVLTGFSDYNPLVDAINKGKVQGYFSKPLDPVEFNTRVKKGLELFDLRKKNQLLLEYLKFSEEQFRTLFEQAADSIILIDPETYLLINFNSITHQNLGYSPEELRKIKIYELSATSPEAMKMQIDRVSESNSIEFEVQLKGKNHRFHDFLMKFKQVSIHSRTYILGICSDITQQKKAQAELKQSEEFLNAIIENIPDMIIVKDAANLNFMRINVAGEELFGHSRKELIGKTVYDFFSKDEADLLIIKDREALTRNDGMDIPEETIQTIHQGKRILHTKKIPILDDRGQARYLLDVSEDITENMNMKKKEKNLEAQIRQLQKMEAIGTLAGGIAHDFNNILAPIIGYTELLLYDMNEGTQSYKNLKAVLSAAQRARELVHQILMFARQSEPEVKPLRLQPLIKETIKFMRSSLPSTIEIRQDIDENCGPVMADPTKMQQVLINLCTNGYHAMQENGGVLEISLSEVHFSPTDLEPFPNMTKGRYLKLVISDTGAGMTADVIERIFEPYFTTKAKGEGTGLGLSLVHGIVTSYKGTIKVTSEYGRGTVFTIFLPVDKPDATPEKSTVPHDLPTGNEHILLVDDEIEIAKMMSQMLERLGYRVTMFTSSSEALSFLEKHASDIDLVISDLTMPKFTGLELAKRLSEIRKDLKVLICTGFSERISKEKAEDSGIKGIIMKPVIMNDIAKIIRRVLEAM